jgi:hypothetical protein
VISGDISTGGQAAQDVEVSVDGHGLAVRTDAGGRFRLDGIAAGDRTLTLSKGSDRATLAVAKVREGEQIELQIAFSGSKATVRSVHRGGGGGSGSGPLTAELSPDTWNTNWAGSNGNLTLFFRGEGYDLIDPASILLIGDDALELPLAPSSARVEGSHLKAKFPKAEAFGLLLEPVLRGETRTLTVEFLQDGTPLSLAVPVRIVGSSH